MAIKEEQGQAGLASWPDALRCREPAALDAARQRLAGRCGYFKAVQFFFYDQWTALKAYANGKGVRLIGDIPIYVSPDSSDLWTRPELFQTDGQVRLTRVAGCPPDSFAADGQLWGNPLYDWPRHEAEGFAWWKQRMRHATSIYDVVRIDHFRGFESYFSIPAGSATAQGGQWVKGPGQAFLDAMHQAVGRDAVIAEDLGYLTDEVKALLAASGCPGMKIMQFAFDSREPGNYLPYTYTAHSVVYTGTHDNITTEGWQQTASREDVAYACRYLRCEPAGLTDAMICACLASVSDLAVIPMADWLHLGPEARINTPSTQSGNWRWRLDAAALTRPWPPGSQTGPGCMAAALPEPAFFLSPYPFALRKPLCAPSGEACGGFRFCPRPVDEAAKARLAPAKRRDAEAGTLGRAPASAIGIGRVYLRIQTC